MSNFTWKKYAEMIYGKDIKKTKYLCFRCKSLTNKNISNQDYFRYCPNCDEDMYEFEVEEK